MEAVRGKWAIVVGRVVGVVITGYTRHGLHRAIGGGRPGVSPKAILDAVRNPVKIINKVDRETIRYVGRDASVLLNQAGKIVTTWSRNRGGHR